MALDGAAGKTAVKDVTTASFKADVLAALFVVILAATLFGGVMHGVDRMLRDAPFRLDAPAQQV